MADIHREADDIVDGESERAWSALIAGALSEVQWTINAAHHLWEQHDLSDHEMVQLVRVAHEATLQKIQLLEMD